MEGEGAEHVQGVKFDDVWIEFYSSWSAVRWGLGQNPVPSAFQRAREQGPCGAATRYENELLRILVTACKLLQEERGEDNPFFLSTRSAAEELGVTRRWAGKMLRVLCGDGLLRLVKPGVPGCGGAGTAARFLYVGD